MHPAYFDTHFQCEEPIDDWPSAFAIITAYATTGEKWSQADNAEADQKLQAELHLQCRWVRRLTGYSPVTGHAEPGWAAEISFAAACDMGRRFWQDAIYYIIGYRLQVSHCDDRRGLVEVGMFRERVHLEGFH